MEKVNPARIDLINSLTKKTLPSIAFVSAGAPKSNLVTKEGEASATCEGGCGGQCISGCKDQCVTVSK